MNGAAGSTRAGRASLDRSAGFAACVAATMASGLVTVRGPWPWIVVFAIVMFVLGVIAVTAPRRVPPRSVAFCAAMFVLYALGGLLEWPPALTTVLVCAVPLGVLLLALSGTVRDIAPWLTAGRRPDRAVLVLAATAVTLAALALTVWALVTRPDAGPYLDALAGLPLWVALLGVVAFALVNPVWEELLFRGVLLEDLRLSWGPVPAVAGQAVVFGAAHWAGFPSGWVGMTMAGVWGAALGVIRLRTGGLLVPYLVHVTVNAVIGLLAVLLLT